MQGIALHDHQIGNFGQARRVAVDKASEFLARPVIVAWKDDQNGRFAPEIPGGKGDRWHDYGEGNEGVPELEVGDALYLIFTDAEGFAEPDLNLATLEDNGTQFLCLNDACTEEDKQKLGYSQAAASAASCRSAVWRLGPESSVISRGGHHEYRNHTFDHPSPDSDRHHPRLAS